MRAIIFDFDGVIANSEPLQYRSLRDALGEEGIELAEVDYYERYLGYDDVGAFRAIGADHDHPFDIKTIDELVESKAVRLEALEREGPILFPGAAEAVQRMAASYPLAIASGALRPEIERVLERSGLARFFVGIVAADDTPLSKPAPDPYRRAVDLLRRVLPDLQASECLAIEDSRWGLESARAAGLKTVAVTHSYEASVFEGACDLVIASLDAVVPASLIQSIGFHGLEPRNRP